jgi:hypothetical protein
MQMGISGPVNRSLYVSVSHANISSGDTEEVIVQSKKLKYQTIHRRDMMFSSIA